MAANTWSSILSTDGNLVTNWSLGALAATDILTFDATSVVDCTFTAGIACAGINATAAYTGTLNFSASSLTHAIGVSGLIADCTGLTWGTGNSISIAGTLDVQHVTTITVGTSTVTMTGTGNLLGKATTSLGTLTIAASAVVTLTATFAVSVLFTMNGGSVSIATGCWLSCSAACDSVFTSGIITATGTGYWRFSYLTSGHGITVFTAGTVSTPITVLASNANAVFAPGTYGGLVTICNQTTGSGTFTPSAGTYTFAGGLTVLCDDATATVTVNFSANNPTIILQGSLRTTVTAGTVTITKGTQPKQVTGTAALTLNLAGKDYGTWILNKSAGAITFTSGDTITAGGNWTLPSLTEPAGVSIDFGDAAYTHAIAGDCICDGTALDWGTGNAISVGGTLDVQHVTTITVGTSTVTMTGTGNLLGKTTSCCAILVIDVTANVTVTIRFRVSVSLTMNGGTLTITTAAVVLEMVDEANLVFNSGTIAATGSGTIQIRTPTSGHGLTVFTAGTFSAPLVFTGANAAAVLTPGTYSGLVTIVNYSAVSCTWTPSAGTYTFAGGLTVTCNGASATTTVALSNATTFNITTLTATNSTAGTLEITTAGNPAISVTGNIVFTNSGGGTFTYTKGASGTITLSGTGAQTVNLAGKTADRFILSKAVSGAITWTSGDSVTLGGVSTITALTLPAGLTLFDANDYAVAVSGNVTASCTTLDCGTGLWTVGGNLNTAAVTTLTNANAASWLFNGIDTQTLTFGATKTLGAVTLNGAALLIATTGTTFGNTTITAGALNLGGRVLNTGNFAKTAVATWTKTGLVGAILNVTGTFANAGNMGPDSGIFYLNATGAATSSAGEVKNVDASGGHVLILGRSCTEAGTNTHVRYAGGSAGILLGMGV
jgi:fibronectin-binding autotransporter adhesin